MFLLRAKLDGGDKNLPGLSKGGMLYLFLRSRMRRPKLPKYLVELSYTAAGSAGVFKDGGSKRRAEAEKLVQSLGGTVECMY